MRLWASLCLVSSLAAAAPRTVTIGAGDCKSAELAAAIAVLSAAVASNRAEVLGSDAVLERFRPLPTATAEDLGRQLEAAQTQFYSGTYERALETLRAALAGIERLSPRAEPWPLLRRALMLEGLVFKAMGKKSEALDAQRRVLRIEPFFKLDTDYYTPTTIQAFDALRKEVQKAKKARLTITSQPTGVEVFVDGAGQGRTPYAGEFPLGEYRLSLADGDARSFERELKLSRDEAVQIDLAFEGSLSPTAPLCVSSGPHQGVDTALKLAALAGAENAVILQLESRNNEPGWVAATLFDVNKGAKVRDGGIRFTGPRRDEVLSDLAGFLLTGNNIGLLQEPVPAAKREASVVPGLGEPKPQPPPVSPVAVEGSGARGLGPRITSFLLVGAGAIAAGSGLAVYLGGGSDRAALAPLLDEQGRVKSPANAQAARDLQGRIDSNSLTALLLGAGGAAAVAAGVAVFFLLPPQSAAQLSVVPTADGFWAGAKFRF